MEELKKVVARNLVKYRNLSGLTQVELAKKISYSDKTISKWERGDRLPDLEVLVKLSQIYKVNINEFLNDKTEEQEIVISNKYINRQHILISILSVCLVFFIAAVTFVVLNMIDKTQTIAWLSFIYALPVMSIVLFIFANIWWNIYFKLIFLSMTLWSIVLSICLTIKMSNFWIICVFAIIINLLIIVCFIFKETSKRKNKKMD